MYIRTALFSPPYSTLTYRLPDAFPASFWQKGLRVIVPVGKSLRAACIIDEPDPQAPTGIKCRDILWPLELRPVIDRGLFNMAADLALRQGQTPGFVLGHVLPQGLRDIRCGVRLGSDPKSTIYSHRDLAGMDVCTYSELAKALIGGSAEFTRNRRPAKEEQICSIAIDPPWPLRPAATRQIGIMDLLYENGNLSLLQLEKALGKGIADPLAKLIDRGYVNISHIGPAEDMNLYPPPEQEFSLNADQERVLSDLVNAALNCKAETRLLYGITGSGKTAIYLELIRKVLDAGKSAMLLAPEVALAQKLFNDVNAVLSDRCRYIYHGYQANSQKEDIFGNIALEERPTIVVGTRSALFLPLKNIGCIILDEEHDSSYKQDEGLNYHAKELAWFRTAQNKAVLVLGSATPDIRSFHAGQNGNLPMLRLRARATGASLPPIELAELPGTAGIAPDANEGGLLSPASEAALTDCLSRDEQAVILLNRRGYAPMIYCLGCNKTLRCPHCEIGMAFHKSQGRLICHYCGYSIGWPAPCPDCRGTSYITIGEGTERMAERLEVLAGRPVLRLDRDSARRPERMDSILKSFAAGAAPFLVGTQMLSKGHHFPNVTCVIVADGDIGLNLPDYRAAERSFQLLVQSAGRAGRGVKPGRALIQTRNPGHYCWQHIQKYDYEGFYASELSRRERYKYPPFVKLGLIRLSFLASEEKGSEACRELGQSLRNAARSLGINFMGPAPAPLAMLKGRKRFHCLLKGESWGPMRELWFMAQKHRLSRYLRINLDLDPVNML